MAGMYEMIFKRKSFHLFRGIGKELISEQEKIDIYNAYDSFTPLYPQIRTAIRIEDVSGKPFARGAEYAICLYTEKKENALMNIGYLGEQLDLYLVSRDIGTLWYGIGKPEEKKYDGMIFVIMILIAKVSDKSKFRKDMFKSKRKPMEEIWEGSPIRGVSDIVRFAPSACNLQPWLICEDDVPANRSANRTEEDLKSTDDQSDLYSSVQSSAKRQDFGVEAVNSDAKRILKVYRYRNPGRRGIMPKSMVLYYNQIDIGIFLRFLDVCLDHEGIGFGRVLMTDPGDEREMTYVAEYQLY